MYKHYLLRHLQQNPDFIDNQEIQDHLKESEVSLDEWFSELHEAVNCAIEGLWESASDKFDSQVRGWYNQMDYVNHDLPEGVDSEEFAKLVVKQVSMQFNSGINTLRTPN